MMSSTSAFLGAILSLRWLAAPLVLFLLVATALGAEQTHPLKPPDRSSPRAALQTFLDSADTLATFLAEDYLADPSREKFNRLISLSAIPLQALDLSEVPPAAREKAGRAAAVALYEILSRIPLPPPDEIPDASEVKQPAGATRRAG